MTDNETPIAGDEAGATLEAQLRDEIEALRGEIEQLRADSLRERADLENQRKRLARDMEQARRFANERLLGELLPVFDSLDAGLAAAAGQDGPLKDGLDLTYRQLLKVAADNGLAVLDPAGQPFNPEHHQAISQADPAGAAPGTGVSCATCHLPREVHQSGNDTRVLVQHNQNYNLRPNEKMLRSVCLNCHGLAFSIDALADAALVRSNFIGRPAGHVESIDLALRRQMELQKRK